MADRVIPGIYRSYRKYKGVRGGDATRGDYRRERRAYLGNAEAVAGRLAAWDTLSGRYWNVGRVAPVDIRDDAWLDSWSDGYVSGMGDAEFDVGRYRDLYGRRHYDNYVGSLMSEGVPEEEADAMYWERFPAGPVDASSRFGAGEYFGNERGEAGAQPVGLANVYLKYVNPLSAGVLMGTDALVDAYRSGDWSSVPVDVASAAAPLGSVKGFVREAAQGVKEAAKNNLKRDVKKMVNDNAVKAVADGGDDALDLMRGAQEVSMDAAGKPEAAAQALQYLFKPYRGVGDDIVGGIYFKRFGDITQRKSGSAYAGKSGFGKAVERATRGGVRSDVFVRKADIDAVPGLKLKTQAVKTEGLGNDARAFRKSVGENANPKDYVKVSTEELLRSKAQPGEAADRLSDAVSAQLKAKTVSGDVPAYFNKYTQRNPATFWRWNAGIGIGSGLVSGYKKAIGYGQNRDEWDRYTEGVANSGYNEFDSWMNRQDKAVRDNAYRAVLNMRGEPTNEDESRYRQAEDAIVRQLVSEGYSAEDAYRMFNAWASGIMGIGEDTPDYYKCGGKLYAGGGPLKDARYNTVLSPEQEREYAAWVETLPVNLRSDYDYDLRGAWLAGERPDGSGHMSDRWKKPWHATFSDESVYSGDGTVGGHWYGGRFEPSAVNRYVGGFRYGNWGANSFAKGGYKKYASEAEALKDNYGIDMTMSKKAFRQNRRGAWAGLEQSKDVAEQLASQPPYRMTPTEQIENYIEGNNVPVYGGNYVYDYRNAKQREAYKNYKDYISRLENPTVESFANRVAERPGYRGLAGLMTGIAASPLVLSGMGNAGEIYKILTHPITDMALTAHGAITAPSNIKKGIESIKKGNVGEGVADFGLTALDLMGAGQLLGRTGRMLNRAYRAKHAYDTIAPVGYEDVLNRGKKWIKDLWYNPEVDLYNPKWLKELKNENPIEDSVLGIWGYMPHGILHKGEIADKARMDAWAIYNGLPQPFQTYVKNADGTYSYDMKRIMDLSEGTWYPAHAPKKGKGEKGMEDFVTGAGGGLTGFKLIADDEYGNGIMRVEDVWDLHPFSRWGMKFNDKLGNRLVDKFGSQNRRDTVQKVREKLFDAGIFGLQGTPIQKIMYPLDKLMNHYRMGMFTPVFNVGEHSEVRGLANKLIYDFTKSKMMKSLSDKLKSFEVGKISGGKPFKMQTDIPFHNVLRNPDYLKEVAKIKQMEDPVSAIEALQRIAPKHMYEYGFNPYYFNNINPTFTSDNVQNITDIINNVRANGGQIHIKPENRGKFTAAANRAGKSVQAYASQILANKWNYSPTLVKQANFARNAAKWHAYGGYLYGLGGSIAKKDNNN